MEYFLIMLFAIVIVALVYLNFKQSKKIGNLNEVSENYSVMVKNYSTITILQEIMVILGTKMPASDKLEQVNNILVSRFGITYSSIIECKNGENKVKISNVDDMYWEYMKEIDKEEIFQQSISTNIPKYVTAIQPLGYPSAFDRSVCSVLVFPLFRNEEYHGLWILEDTRPNAFDNVEKIQLSIIKDNITLILQNNDYAQDLEIKTNELQIANKKLYEMANRDGLTGAFNKAFMHQKLDEVFNGSQRRSALMIMDIDHFKKYNDQNGHMEGDNLLKALAQLLSESLRDKDFLFRFGGEEFVILFPETAREDATMVADRLRQKVADYVFPFEEKQPGGNLTISVGVAFCPDDATNKEQLLLVADERLYKAKEGGRNRVVAE